MDNVCKEAMPDLFGGTYNVVICYVYFDVGNSWKAFAAVVDLGNLDVVEKTKVAFDND